MFRVYIVCLALSLAPYTSLLASDAHLGARCGLFDAAGVQRLAEIRHGLASEERPQLTEFADSPDRRFRIHFTRSGPDAVPLEDSNNNGLPDFVEAGLDALTTAWRTFADTMGYRVPPRDGLVGGSDAVDVYLHDLSQAGEQGLGWYGRTVPETRISAMTPERFTAWMEMDNDFSADDRNRNGNPVFATTGIDGLRVTCSHELHHVFQIGSYGVTDVQRMVYELTSTWMEIRTLPNVPDWVTYSKRLFETPAAWPMSETSSSAGYVWGFFGNILHQNGNDAILRTAWENIALGELPFPALARACEAFGAPLGQRLASSLDFFYRTGSRSLPNDVLPHTALLPEVFLSADSKAIPPSIQFTGELRAMEVRAFRCALPSAAGGEDMSTAIVITWPDTDAFIRADALERKMFTVSVLQNPLTTDVLLAGTTWGIRVEPPSIAAWIDGSVTQRIPSPYPHPVVLSASRNVFVPVEGAKPGDVVDVEVLTMNFVGVDKQSVTVSLDNDRIVALLELAPTVSPGTYLVRCTSNGVPTLHKVVVRR